MASPRIGRKVEQERKEKTVMDPRVEAKSQVADPEAAARVLLGYLPDFMQTLILECHETLRRPLWQVLLGYTVRMHEIGELFSPLVLGEWGARMPATSDRTCKQCGQIFKSPTPDGMWCCERCFFGKVDTMGHAKNCLIPHVNAPEPVFEQEAPTN